MFKNINKEDFYTFNIASGFIKIVNDFWTSSKRNAVCPRSLCPFYIQPYCIKWVKASWTYSKRFWTVLVPDGEVAGLTATLSPVSPAAPTTDQSRTTLPRIHQWQPGILADRWHPSRVDQWQARYSCSDQWEGWCPRGRGWRGRFVQCPAAGFQNSLK